MSINIENVLAAFGISEKFYPYGDGHINDTYRVDTDPPSILQRINSNVFKNPLDVMDNIAKVTEFLSKKIVAEGGDPDRETLNIIKTTDGKDCVITDDGSYYRMYWFVRGTKSYNQIENPDQLYRLAKAFGKFTNLLADYPADTLHEVIVDFHNTKARYEQFETAVNSNLSGRRDSALPEIKFVEDRKSDCELVVNMIAEGKIPLRVTHNDTKLNNVLFDAESGDAICVIDLDTVMPGSLLYDYGDALRFAGSSGAEDEQDLSKIWFVTENFEAFTRGFIETLPSITEEELKLLPFSIKLMSLECGSRFLADYLNGDTYFRTHYPEQNLIRCRTQFKLVEEIENKMDELNATVERIARELK